MATKSSFYSNTGTTTNNIASITSLNNEATASKDAAAVSATNAATSATASEVSNAAALVSKTAAASSATTASGHKDTATTQAALATTNGAAQVALATTQAGLATTNGAAQVALATTQAGLATTNGAAQVTLATTQATNAASSATAAASSATSASSSASSATSSASTATTKASEASTSASEAAAYLDLFTDQYLGAKSSAPTVDNDGDALTNGDLYFNTTTNSMQVWNGSAWTAAYISGAGYASLSGATFTGNVTVPNLLTAGNVDGRDVSVDGTKLDGIASSANNYVHPNHSGDVVSTADGATVIQVDAVDIPMLSATGTASSTTFLRGDNAWVTPTDTNTTYSVGDGGLTQINFTSADNTKLDAIEGSADVTDATNVTAAGALMDSELTAIASVKALNQGVATGDSPTFAALTSTGVLTANGGFTANDGSTITTDDNSNNLSLISTDADAASGPNLRLFRNSASPADNDQLGSIFFSGEDDGGNETNYAQIDAYAKDVTDGTEDGLIVINSMVAGTSRSRARFSFDETVINQDGVDLDFRVESDNLTHALFVQGSDGAVGIGTASPILGKVHVLASGTSDASMENVAHFGKNSTSRAGLQILANATLVDVGMQAQAGAGNLDLSFSTLVGGGRYERLRILSSGGLTFNGDTAAANALDDYEEGTWTPTIGNTTLNSGTLAFDAKYTKVGNLVTVSAYQTGGNITWTTSEYLSGLPFAPAQGAGGLWTNNSPNTGGQVLFWTNSNIYLAQARTSEAGLIVTGMYYV